MTGTLAGLQDWYRDCGDGEPEHHYGVTIQSLDNPGWLVTIDLAGTALIDCRFDAIDAQAGAPDWMHRAVQDARFRGAGGPHMLDAAPRVCLDRARTNTA